jgi:hypothetical protein
MSWYYNENQDFIDATQILQGGGGGAFETEINDINDDLNELKEVFKPKQLNTENASLDTIIVNNTANARIFIKNQNTTPKIKIEGGKFYLYYDYDVTNAPTITAGWIDLDNYVTAIKQSVIGIEVVLIPLEVYVFGTAPTQLQGQILQLFTITGTHSGQILTIQEEVAGQAGLIAEIRVEINYLSRSWFDPMSPLTPTTFNQSLYNQRIVFEEAVQQAIDTARQTAMGTATARFGSSLLSKTLELGTSYLNYVLIGLGGVGVVVGLLFQLWDNINDEASVKLERKILLLYEKLGENPQNDLPKHIHKDGLLIIESTNTGLLSINEYTVTLSNEAILVIKVSLVGSALKASLSKVKEVGEGTFTVGNIINIPKSSIGGTTGNLQIQVTSLISERQVLTNILAEIKISRETSNNRRRLREGIINTDELGDGFVTTYDTTLTNTETGEVLQVPTIKVKLNTNQFETISGAIQIKPSFLGKGLEIVADKLLLDLNTAQFNFINNDLNIIGYDQALTNISTIQSDVNAIEANLVTIDTHLVNIDKLLLPYGATIQSDYKLNLGYKDVFLNYPYDLMMMAINPTSYTTFSTTSYNNDYLGYFPNMSRLALGGDAKVIYDTQVTANSFQQFTKGFIFLKNTNDSKVFNLNRKFEFVSFLKFVSFTNNTTDYHLIQSGVDLGTQIEVDYSKLSVYIRNRKLVVEHPALVEYQSYQVGTTNFLTTYIVNNSYIQLSTSDEEIGLRAGPQLVANQLEYKYAFEMRNIGFYRLTTYAPNLIKVINDGYTSEPINDTTYVAFYLSHPNDSSKPIAQCIYPFLDLKIGQLLNGSYFDVSPTFIRRVTLKFDIIFNTTLGQNYPDTKYQYSYAETTERCDFTFRLTYTLTGTSFIEHNFSMANVNPVYTTTGTNYDSYFSNPNGQAIFPKRYWTYSFDIPGTYPDTGLKLRGLTLRLIPKANAAYQYGTTASYLYNFQPILYLFKYILTSYNATTSPTQVITNNYLTTNQSTALSSGLLSSKFYLMTLQMDLPNNNIGFYVDENYYNFTERLPVKLYPADTTMPDTTVLFVNANFVSWANLTTTNNVLVLGNIPSTGEVQFTHFNYRYFQSTEQFLTLTQVQKLMGLISYNYYYDYVSVDKLLDTNEIFANQVLTKQLVVNNNKVTKTFTSTLRTRDLRTNQTQDEGNILIPIRNLYVENPTASGNLSYSLATKTFSIGGGTGTRSEEDDIILAFIEDSAGTGLQWNNTNKTLNVIPESLWQDLTPIYTLIDANDHYASNYVDITSNYLKSQIDSKIPYDDTAITALINTKDLYVSNYVKSTSNILFSDYVARDAVLNTKIDTTSNLLFTDYILRDAILNTKIDTTSNLLFTDFVARDAVLNTRITTTSNLLFTDYVARDAVLNASITSTSNLLFTDYVARDAVLNASIEANKYTNTKVFNYLAIEVPQVKSLLIATNQPGYVVFAKYNTAMTALENYYEIITSNDGGLNFNCSTSNNQYFKFSIFFTTILLITSAYISANKNVTITGTNVLQFETGTPAVPTITGGTGTKIILSPATSGVYPYSIGISPQTLYQSVPTGGNHTQYINGVLTNIFSENLNIFYGSTQTSTLQIGMGVPSTGTYKYAISFVAEPIVSFGRCNFALNVNNYADNINVSVNETRMRIRCNSYTELYGAFPIGYNLALRFFNYSTQIVSSTSTTLNDVVLRVYGSTWNTSWVSSSSSIKIKKDVEDLDDAECLTKLLALRPVKYRYIDYTKNFNPEKKVYGFIAEEVKEVIPEAVDDKQSELIPNIYLKGSVENNILTCEKELEINVEYHCYFEDEKEAVKITTLTKLSDTEYEINKTYENKKDIFVYGKIDNNFHCLKKEYLHSIAISSIQEHNRIIMKQKEEIADLTARLARLEGIVTGMLDR